jgi:hypothetical protein
MGLKINWSVSVLFSFIAFILGWLSSVFMFCEPMSLATFMKKLLNKQNWEIYRKQRNLVNKIKKQSIRNNVIERCAGGPKSKHFWPTIKPFSVFMFCEPMSLATFMKKLLNVSATSVWLFIILSFSHRSMSLAK